MVSALKSVAILFEAEAFTSELRVEIFPTWPMVTCELTTMVLPALHPVSDAAIRARPATIELKRFKDLPKNNFFKVTAHWL